jgi:transposase
MDLSRYLVDAVVLEGRSYRDVAAAHGVSKSLVAKLVARFRSGGYEAIAPRPRIARTIRNRTPDDVEDRIVELRKQLTDAGFDAGAETIRVHLLRETGPAPSVSTVWRVLRRRGFVTPQPHDRAAPGSASRPTCQTSAGSPTSPTGPWPTAVRPRS